MGKRYLGLLACAFIVRAPAFATVVTINSSDYVVGTNVTNSLSGVTLGYATTPPLTGGPPSTFNVSPLVVGTLDKSDFPVAFNTLGSYTFQLYFWQNGAPAGGDANAIYMAFATPVYSVTATDFSPYDDTSEILALDSQGSIIGAAYSSAEFCSPATCSGPDGGIFQTETYSSTKPITSVLIGADDDATYVTSISFSTTVPEPPSIAIFATGLLGLVIVTLRRRRRS